MRYFNAFLILLFTLLFSCKEDTDPPNMVFIIADDISWNDFGCYSNGDVRTPNIDRLASEGLKFNNVYLTASSCSPSRTSIISGRYPHNTGAAELHTPLPAHLTVFPEELRKAGYHTGASGKWHMGEPAKRGFDTLTITDIGPGGEKHWLNMIRERPMDKPFFFWLASIDAHRDWSADTCPNPHDPDLLTVSAGLADMAGTRQDLASYYNEVQRFDRYVGLVFDELKKQEVLDNTLVIVMADNGRPFPRAKTRVYDSGMKTPFIAWWPAGIEQPGTEVNALVSIIDLAPTFTSLAGLEPDKYYQGKSFSELFLNPAASFRNYVFAEHNWHDYEAYERMVRSVEYMYVYNGRPQFANQGPADAVTSPSMQDLYKLEAAGKLNSDQLDVLVSPRKEEELFYMADDPVQLLNVTGKPDHAPGLEMMRTMLRMWQQQTADTKPGELTPDWYLRKADSYVQTKMHGIRGEMPGASLRADTVTRGGPF
ncbi:MAG: sulfatase [Bacteroidales bacterium]|nr:sulfatase [Bacteroidales bacterium]